MDDVSAYDVADANFNLALDFAKSFAAKKTDEESESADKVNKMPRNVAILFPDESKKSILRFNRLIL